MSQALEEVSHERSPCVPMSKTLNPRMLEGNYPFNNSPYSHFGQKHLLQDLTDLNYNLKTSVSTIQHHGQLLVFLEIFF